MKDRIEALRAVCNDSDYEGMARDSDGNMSVDRRLTPEAMDRLGLLPRSADLNICGPYVVYVSLEEAEEISTAPQGDA